MKALTRPILSIALSALGLYGLNAGIEYSGWALFVGLMVALGA